MATLVKPPAPQPLPVQTDIQLFAKAYFNIELTSYQMEYIAILAAGGKTDRIRRPRAGIKTADKVVLAYLQAGVSAHGRDRLPSAHVNHLQPKSRERERIKGVTQAGRILNAIKRPDGAFNWELSRIALKYTSVISDLRKDGHDIIAHRMYNKKGKATDTWLYTCND